MRSTSAPDKDPRNEIVKASYGILLRQRTIRKNASISARHKNRELASPFFLKRLTFFQLAIYKNLLDRALRNA